MEIPIECNRHRRRRRRLLRLLRLRRLAKVVAESVSDQEISSVEWEFISMTEQEEDIIRRMFRLVGERWDLIAGRIPGRTAEEIERFWIMRRHDMFAERRQKADDILHGEF